MKRISFLILLALTMCFCTDCDEIGFTYSFQMLEYNHNCPQEDFDAIENYFITHNIPFGSTEHGGYFTSYEPTEAKADLEAQYRFSTIVDQYLKTEEFNAFMKGLNHDFYFTYACIRGFEGGSSFIIIDSFTFPEK